MIRTHNSLNMLKIPKHAHLVHDNWSKQCKEGGTVSPINTIQK